MATSTRREQPTLKGLVRDTWIAGGLVMLFSAHVPTILILAIVCTCLSFILLDETRLTCGD